MKNHLLKSIFISLILILGVSNAWAFNQSNVDLYFDNSNSQWTNCYVYIGSDGNTSCYSMSRVSGTQYLWRLEKGQWNWGNTWNNASGWVVCKEKWWDEGSENVYKFVYHGNNNVTNIRTSAWNNTTIYKADGTQSVTHYSTACTVYKWTTSTKSDYTVTINSPTGGTLTVKDYDNTTVTSGTKKVKLTVLKFSASASTGYTFGGIQINNGSTTTTIAAADIVSSTYTLTSNVTITPIWNENKYTVTVNNDGHGTTTPSGAQENVGQVMGLPIEATPAANYEFVNWTITSGSGSFGSETSASTTFKPTSAATIQANFRSTVTNSLTVVAGANIESVTGSTDLINFGQSYTISATPIFGYKFAEWTAKPAENATIDKAAEATTEVKIQNGSVIVTASATEILAPLTTTNSFDAGKPSLKAPTKTAEKIGIATTATVTATAAPAGYTFTGWKLENCVSADDLSKNSITVKSTGTEETATATANYEIDKYYVVGSFNGWNTSDANYKMIFEDGVYKKEVTFAKDVQFKICNGSWEASWSYDNLKGIEYKELVKSDDKDQNIKLTKDATFTIIFDLSKHLITFEGLNEKYTYVLMGVNKDWTTGIIMERNPDNPHERMLTCQPIEKANDAIKVAILEEGKDAVYCGEVADHSVSCTLGEHDNIVLEDGVYDFYYKIDENKVWIGSSSCTPTFEISATASAGGSVTGTNTYAYKEIATLTATADEGYHFEKWSNGSTDNPLKITVTEDVEIQAIFAINTYTVTATATEGGTVTGARTYDHGTSVTLTATANTGYQFVNWTKADEEVSTNATYSFTVTENVDLVANFEALPPTITEYTRDVPVGYYATMCLPYASSNYTGVEIYEVAWMEKKEGKAIGLYLDQVENDATLEAGKPYIFKATAAQQEFVYEGEEVTEPVNGANGLRGTLTGIAAGNITNHYIIADNKFWVATASNWLDANRAYIDAEDVPNTEPAKLPGRRRVILGAAGENTETGVDNFSTTDTPIKVIQNGQLIIIREGKKHNAMGVKL